MNETVKVTKTTILTLICAGSLIMSFNSNAGELVLKKGDRVAIVGDSITEQKQYSRFIELYLLACVPELDLTMYQFGWSGEKAPGFAKRLQNDLKPWHPTVVTTCYGMNDGLYRPYTAQIGSNYYKGTASIQTQCKDIGVRMMIVGGPGPVDTDTWRPAEPNADKFYNENLAKLSKIAGQLAVSNGFVYAKLHPLMMKVMHDAKAKLGNKYNVCGRRGVHPQANGHLVMAYAFLKAMGLDGAIGTITVDMKSGKTTTTTGQRVLSSVNGKIKIESTRYPFCFFGDGKSPASDRSILPFLPFNQDLNRYLLVVKNLSTPMAEITWGDTTKTFTKEDLQNGINLAAEFLDNPFSIPFLNLDRKVANKQNRETTTIKGIITNFRYLQDNFADDKDVTAATALLRRKLLDSNAQDALQVRAAVKPVTHTIQITPKPTKSS